MHSVLIIDDDQELCDMVVRLLAKEGYDVAKCTDAVGGLSTALSAKYDVILLDIMMPGLDGLQLLRELLAKSQVHVIMLTARGEEIDRVVGLELGADDYLPKPFYSRELIARIRAVLRRPRTAEPKAGDEKPVLKVGDLSLDPSGRIVARAGTPVNVTTAEFDVLQELLAQAGKIVSRDRLAKVLGRNLGVFDRAIDMHISNLRTRTASRRRRENPHGTERGISLRQLSRAEGIVEGFMTKGLFWRVVVAFWVSVVLSIIVIKLLLGSPDESNAAFVWALTSRLLVFLIISGIMMLFATRSVTHPVHWLRSAVQKFASGELGARVYDKPTQLKPASEIEALIRDFNQMAERVEELVRSQRQLIAGVSHELRSPLARLSLAVDLLRKFPQDREEHLARFENELGKLNQLIERLLTLSRLESSTVLLREDCFDLADLAAEVVSDVQFEASARGCSVATVRSEQCPIVGDQALLRSAIENILRNAVQYSDEGTTVSVEVGCNHADATFTVTDTGPGLGEKEIGQIFQPFFRGGEARSRRSDGYGLGLAIASRAIGLHKGTIRAQNTGSGLAVSIRLPSSGLSKVQPHIG